MFLGSARGCLVITAVASQMCFCFRVYLESGETYNPPRPTVRPLMTEVCTFSKSSALPTGSVGVLTYELLEKNPAALPETLAIMFSVPYDYDFYNNWFAVGIYKAGTKCDEELYKQMYNEKNQAEHGFVREKANGSGINYVGSNLEIRATMNPLGKAIMKVEVWDTFSTFSEQYTY